MGAVLFVIHGDMDGEDTTEKRVSAGGPSFAKRPGKPDAEHVD